MEKYEVLERIGEGAHGYVTRATRKEDAVSVALKKVILRKTAKQLPKAVVREIKTMLLLAESKYVVRLLDYFPHSGSYLLVFDYMPSGLWEMTHDPDIHLKETHIKSYLRMLMRGVAYLHSNSVMHRDLKPANLLIDAKGILKIGDFGQARLLWSKESKNRCYTPEVATKWYRAPELLYGAKEYTQSVDLWAVGCILAEMINKAPLFPGETDIDQLATVVKCLGNPSETVWPGVSRLPDFKKISFPPIDPIPWKKLVPGASAEAISLLETLVVYNPKSRVTAKQGLRSAYFFSKPLPCEEEEMPKPPLDHRAKIKASNNPDSSPDSFSEVEFLWRRVAVGGDE